MGNSGFLFSILCVAGLPYITGILLCIIRNKRERERQQNWRFSGSMPNVSLLIAFRNENLRIQPLLDSLATLDFPKDKLEIIMVDDHSSDQTHQKIEAAAKQHQLNIKIFSLPEDQTGKKAAMALARENARSEFLFFTDADVRLPEQWIIQMLSCQQNSGATMVCSEVEVMRQKGILPVFESLEQAALVSVSAASIAAGIPFLCNGAGYLLQISSLEKIDLPASWHSSPGGDDVMLLHAMHRAGKKIAYCRMKDSRVLLSATSIRDFFQQRIRWGSKVFLGGSSGNLWPAVLLWLFHFASVLLSVNLILAAGYYALLLCPVAVFFLRGIWEAALVKDFLSSPDLKRKNQQEERKLEWAVILMHFKLALLTSLLAPLYSIYVTFAGPLILMQRRFQWKGRTYSS